MFPFNATKKGSVRLRRESFRAKRSFAEYPERLRSQMRNGIFSPPGRTLIFAKNSKSSLILVQDRLRLRRCRLAFHENDYSDLSSHNYPRIRIRGILKAYFKKIMKNWKIHPAMFLLSHGWFQTKLWCLWKWSRCWTRTSVHSICSGITPSLQLDKDDYNSL